MRPSAAIFGGFNFKQAKTAINNAPDPNDKLLNKKFLVFKAFKHSERAIQEVNSTADIRSCKELLLAFWWATHACIMNTFTGPINIAGNLTCQNFS